MYRLPDHLPADTTTQRPKTAAIGGATAAAGAISGSLTQSGYAALAACDGEDPRQTAAHLPDRISEGLARGNQLCPIVAG
jgi:hypothetical protein